MMLHITSRAHARSLRRSLRERCVVWAKKASSNLPFAINFLPNTKRRSGEFCVLLGVGNLPRQREVRKLVRHVASTCNFESDDLHLTFLIAPLLHRNLIEWLDLLLTYTRSRIGT